MSSARSGYWSRYSFKDGRSPRRKRAAEKALGSNPGATATGVAVVADAALVPRRSHPNYPLRVDLPAKQRKPNRPWMLPNPRRNLLQGRDEPSSRRVP